MRFFFMITPYHPNYTYLVNKVHQLYVHNKFNNISHTNA